ncbi:MAG: murein hydrolase activator EnvC family protein [Gemmatimonadota bacterium]
MNVRTAARALAAAWALAATPAVAQDVIGERIQESQRRLDEIRRERDRLSSEMEDLSGQVHTVSEEIRNLERRIGTSSSVLAELDVQIHALGDQVSETTREMLLTRDKLTVRQAELRERLREIYKRGPLHAVQVLLGARSFADLISRYKYLHLVALYDRMLVQQVKRLERSLADHRARLTGDFAHMSGLRTEKASELGVLERLESQRRRRLANVRARESRAQNRLAALARAEQELRDLIVELERARREAERLAGAASTSTLRTSDLGRLNWPVEGEILYRFGPERRGNTTINRGGMGIGAPRGTPVRAVEAGRVEWAGARGLQGETVILNHGGGYWSIYLYLERLRVRVGDRVEPGQVLGHVGGDDGSGQGPHIEFQILEPGPGEVPREVDPVRWLRGRS